MTDKILFFSVKAYDYTPDNPLGYIDRCPICLKKSKLHVFIYFKYYNKSKRRTIRYQFPICEVCHEEKINNKSLDEMKLIIPLMKVKNSYFLRDKTFITLPVSCNNFYDNYINKNGKHRKNLDLSNDDKMYDIYVTNKEAKEYIK